jgi:subtilase family serine protease
MNIKTLFSLGIIFLFSSVFASAALDLQFTTAISQSPNPASVGNPVTFTVSFRTTNGAVANLKIIGGVDGAQLFERSYASILADKVRTDSFTWTATAGNHTVWFELDPTHSCGDSNYANNRIEKVITVGGAPGNKPDLYISSVTNSPTKFSAGDPVTLTIKVANKGTADSPASDLFMKDQNGKVLMTYPIPGIPQGGQFEHSIVWTGLCDTVLTIKVDTLKKADESDENNNSWSQKMVCGSKGIEVPIDDIFKPAEKLAKPDLTVQMGLNLKYFHSANSEGLVLIVLVVKNIGTADSKLCELVLKNGDTVVKTTKIMALHGHTTLSPFPELSTIAKCGDKLSVQIDSNNVNTESNEDNNTASKTIVCLDLKK